VSWQNYWISLEQTSPYARSALLEVKNLPYGAVYVFVLISQCRSFLQAICKKNTEYSKWRCIKINSVHCTGPSTQHMTVTRPKTFHSCHKIFTTSQPIPLTATETYRTFRTDPRPQVWRIKRQLFPTDQWKPLTRQNLGFTKWYSHTICKHTLCIFLFSSMYVTYPHTQR
jgi:hypothetical protein